MKHFQVHDTEPYFENLQRYFENLPRSKLYKEFLTILMKKLETSDPNKDLLRYNANCDGEICKAMTAIILDSMEQLKKSPPVVTINPEIIMSDDDTATVFPSISNFSGQHLGETQHSGKFHRSEERRK